MFIDYSSIGKRIAAVRKKRGLKQHEVCEIAEINDKYLSVIENARSIPSLEVILRICKALYVTPNDILTDVVFAEPNVKQRLVYEKMIQLDMEQLQFVDGLLDYMLSSRKKK